MVRYLFYEIVEPSFVSTSMANQQQTGVIYVLQVQMDGGAVRGYDRTEVTITPDEHEQKAHIGGCGGKLPFYVFGDRKYVLRSDGSLFERVVELTDEELGVFSHYDLFSFEKNVKQSALQKTQDVLSAKYRKVEELSPLGHKVPLKPHDVELIDGYISGVFSHRPRDYPLCDARNAGIDLTGGRCGSLAQIEHLFESWDIPTKSPPAYLSACEGN